MVQETSPGQNRTDGQTDIVIPTYPPVFIRRGVGGYKKRRRGINCRTFSQNPRTRGQSHHWTDMLVQARLSCYFRCCGILLAAPLSPWIASPFRLFAIFLRQMHLLHPVRSNGRVRCPGNSRCYRLPAYVTHSTCIPRYCQPQSSAQISFLHSFHIHWKRISPLSLSPYVALCCCTLRFLVHRLHKIFARCAWQAGNTNHSQQSHCAL